MKRGLARSRRQVNDFDRRVERDAGFERQDIAVGEKGGVERGERLRRLARYFRHRGLGEVGTLAHRLRDRAEPDPALWRQAGQLGGEAAIDEHETGARARQAERRATRSRNAATSREAGGRAGSSGVRSSGCRSR